MDAIDIIFIKPATFQRSPEPDIRPAFPLPILGGSCLLQAAITISLEDRSRQPFKQYKSPKKREAFMGHQQKVQDEDDQLLSELSR